MKTKHYKKLLGFVFFDNQKQSAFINRMQLFFQKSSNIDYSYKNERDFCYKLGIPCLLDNKSVLDFDLDEPSGLARVWQYLMQYRSDFREFLFATVLFINTFCGEKTQKNLILYALKQALEDSEIDYDLIKDADGYFFFPKGAKELDDGLVSHPLRWVNK